ncbi:cytochrome-c peroxidase [Variovorax sp. YR216]|uniref:cytochrome-c peroxidase n=1 Tax=Variovorax sp. YR216 TaxID=1882828 RepID=UPI000894C37C|nr:cytochrome c peroxidase [Variovorax sp. YR216]SEB03678.1 cytochrome c peroxidase [Variovorax sp. YR216]
MRKVHATRRSSIRSFAIQLFVSCAALTLAACGGGGGSGGASPTPAAGTQTAGTTGNPSGTTTNTSNLSLAAQVGQKLFFDQDLSGSKNQSCASCHDPNYAYGPPNSLAVQLGSDGLSKGQRAVPSLRYKDMTPPYSDVAENPDGVTTSAPGGGFMLDGRAPTLAEQVTLPLLNPIEMNNASKEAVVQVARSASYAALFKQAFGANALDDTDTAFADIGQAIAAFETEDISFHPYKSKYDLYIGNKIGGTLTAAEMRGLAIFNRQDRGNCLACHFQGANFNGSAGLMTDFTYQAIGAPRNDRSIPNNPDPIPANDDPAYFDMGLCGPANDNSYNGHKPGTPKAGAAPDPFTGANNPDPYCGRFKVPTLRNVASRSVFFHNGVFHSLEQVVRFYNTRDTNPEYWYPSTGGSGTAMANPPYALQPTYVPGATVNKFNDLPAIYQGNIDEEAPLGQGQTDAGGNTALNGAQPRVAGSTSQLTEQDMKDLICFLGVLSDGYQPPAEAPTGGTCVN